MDVPISAICPDCGQVSFPNSEMLVCISRDPDWTTYVFECPKCEKLVRYMLRDRVLLRELIRANTPYCDFEPQLEIRERIEADKGEPPITYDDLLDFHLALRDIPTAVAGTSVTSI